MSSEHKDDAANVMLAMGSAFKHLPWFAEELARIQFETAGQAPLPELDYLEPVGADETEIDVEVPEIAQRLLHRASAASGAHIRSSFVPPGQIRSR